MSRFKKFFAALVTGSLFAIGAQVVQAPPAAACIGSCGEINLGVYASHEISYGALLNGGGRITDFSDGCRFTACTAPSGTVEWFIDGVSQGVMTVTHYESEGEGTSLFGGLYARPEAGAHRYDWVYSGNFDETFVGFNGRVDQVATSIRITHDPYVTEAGERVPFSVRVAGIRDHPQDDFPFPLSGTVDIFDDGKIVHTASPVDGVLVAGIALDGWGEHHLTARYNGDRNFAASLDLAPPISHTITKATASAALGRSPNATTLAGQDVSFTSTITPTSSTNVFTPTGNITFTDGAVTLGTSALNASGVATLTRKLDAGLHKVVATYAGDQNFEPVASVSVVHSVDKASTTNTLTGSRASTVVGEPFDLTATIGVVEPGSGAPTGTVTFTDLSSAKGAVTIGMDTISVLRGDPTAITTSALAVGSHQLTSTYNGDGDYHPQTASPITHVVDKATTRVGLNALRPSALGVPMTVRATVAVVAPGAGTPTGYVQFFEGDRPLGRPVLAVNRVASIVVPSFSGGIHNVTASYLGDGNFLGATGVRAYTVTCTRTVTGNLKDYRIPVTGTTCLTNAIAQTALTVPAGARVSIVDSSLLRLTVNARALALVVCDSSLTTVNATRASGPVVFGDDVRSACGGNAMGATTLSSNARGMTVFANSVSGNLTVQGTRGAPTLIGANTVNGALRCSNNVPVANNLKRANTATTRTGECAALDF
jgi:hypothetical protein